MGVPSISERAAALQPQLTVVLSTPPDAARTVSNINAMTAKGTAITAVAAAAIPAQEQTTPKELSVEVINRGMGDVLAELDPIVRAVYGLVESLRVFVQSFKPRIIGVSAVEEKVKRDTVELESLKSQVKSVSVGIDTRISSLTPLIKKYAAEIREIECHWGIPKQTWGIKHRQKELEGRVAETLPKQPAPSLTSNISYYFSVAYSMVAGGGVGAAESASKPTTLAPQDPSIVKLTAVLNKFAELKEQVDVNHYLSRKEDQDLSISKCKLDEAKFKELMEEYKALNVALEAEALATKSAPAPVDAEKYKSVKGTLDALHKEIVACRDGIEQLLVERKKAWPTADYESANVVQLHPSDVLIKARAILGRTIQLNDSLKVDKRETDDVLHQHYKALSEQLGAEISKEENIKDQYLRELRNKIDFYTGAHTFLSTQKQNLQDGIKKIEASIQEMNLFVTNNKASAPGAESDKKDHKSDL